MQLCDARSALVTAITDIYGLRAHEHRPVAAAALDAWPRLVRIEPSTFATCLATFDVIVVLSGDEESAETALDDLGIQIVNALGHALMTPVSVAPAVIAIGGADLYSLVATVILEVEP